jgi:hypothetical protein
MTQNRAIADVYAGDTTPPDDWNEHEHMVFVYTIEADAEPDVLARIAGLFNLANLAPLSVNLRRKSSELVVLTVEIGPMRNALAEMIRRKVAQLTCVNEVTLAGARSRT